MARRFTWSREHPALGAAIDWLGVFVASTSFVFVALWAASPDSAKLTLEEAIFRAGTYSVPVTLGMWGISRATRRGSAVPPRMSEAMPYARLGRDGKPESVTWKDQDGKPLGGGGSANSGPGHSVAD